MHSTTARHSPALAVIWFLILLAVVVIAFISLASESNWSRAPEPDVDRMPTRPERLARPTERILNLDRPTERFRDNLVAERAYLTAGHSFGSSNQLISHIKMIALASRLDRIPIVDNLFGGDHGEGGEVRVSEFYDLDRLSRTLGSPILEWQDVKRNDPGVAEELVCWHTFVGRDVATAALSPFNIHTSFWPIPDLTRDTSLTKDSALATLGTLEALAIQPPDPTTDGGPEFQILRDSLRIQGLAVPAALPDFHLLCFDQMFWVLDGFYRNGRLAVNPDDPAGEQIEDPSTLGSSWREVGQHLHYTPAFARQRDAFLASVLGRAGLDYIAVHIRQGDFVAYGRVADHSVEPFVEAVKQVQAELKRRRVGSRWRASLPVVFATDSTDRDYIALLESRGWIHLDHDSYRTAERFGKWYPSQLDLAVLSDAIGFVGTDFSSFSALAKNRVISWRHGATRMTGKPAKPETLSL